MILLAIFEDYSPSTVCLQIINLALMAKVDKNLNCLFGSTLKQVRTKAGITQQSLAFDCDLDRTYISLLERGLRQPTIKTVFTLSECLNIKPSRLIKMVEDKL